MQAACQIRLFPKLIFNLKILFQFSFFVCGKNSTWVSSQADIQKQTASKICVQQCFTGTQLVNTVSTCWWILCTVGSQPQLFIPYPSPRTPSISMLKKIGCSWIQQPSSQELNHDLHPLGAFFCQWDCSGCGSKQQCCVLSFPERGAECVVAVSWYLVRIALLFFSSLCFGACCCLSSLKSLEVQSTSYKNLLSCDECIILPHLTIFFNTPT